MKSLHSLSSFSGGELSPKLDARVDNKAYPQGLRQLQNMISYKQGPITRRPGTQFVGAALIQGAAVREEKFQFSPETGFTLFFGEQNIQFGVGGPTPEMITISSAPAWDNIVLYHLGDAVEDTADSNIIFTCISEPTIGGGPPHTNPASWAQTNIYTVHSPYSGQIPMGGTVFAADVFALKFCQINDIIYITHPDYPVYSLSRLGDTDWVLEQVPFNSPALLDLNATDTIITPSALQGSAITLTASAPAWRPEVFYNVGNSVQVTPTAGDFIVGSTYVIVSVGTTNFVAIGAASNAVGVQFTATGSGSGTGTATAIYDCILAHVSTSTFDGDLFFGYWSQVQIFNSEQVGGTWQLSTLRDSAYIEYDGTAAGGFSAGTSSSIQCLGPWEVHTYGVWSADIAIQRSLDGGQTFDTVANVTGRSDRNVDITGTAVTVGIFQIVVSNVAVPVDPGATNPRVVFECEDAFLNGTVQITGVTNAYSATGMVVTQLTDSNPLEPEWVSGTAYTAGDQVSYLFINYTAKNNVTSSTPPNEDTTNWAGTAPGGTEYWSEAAWSNYRGFPAAVCSFQQRIIYGGSGFEPQRIWGTVTNDIENFALGDQTQATDAFAFDLNAPGRGPIYWLAAQLELFVGFSGAEWVVSSGSSNQSGGSSGAAITPTNINAVEHSTWGSSPLVEPEIVGDAILYTQRQATTLRQMLFSVYTDKYMSQDLSALSDHLFTSGIVQMAYQARWRRQGIVWCLTQQGTLCALTYDLDQGVFGWHVHSTGSGQVDANGNPVPSDNGFESVCVLDGQNTNEDEVWVVVNRLISGVQTRYFERINPFNWEEEFTAAPAPPFANVKDAFYVDCGLTVTSPGTLTIGGLSQLEGRSVVGLADGYPFGPLVVSSGEVTLPPSIPVTVGAVQIGLPILYFGQPMRIDNDARAGNTQGLVKQISDVYVRVWNAMGGSIWNGTANFPTWVSGNSYTPGQKVISPTTLQAYQCVVADSGSTDPAQSSSWVQTSLPNYRPPVPIPYTPNSSNPFALPVFISEPTDIRITPMLNPSPDADPIVVVTGNDALPLTVLALIYKYDVIGLP